MSRYRGPRTRLVKRLGSLPGYGQKFKLQSFQKKTFKKKQSPFTIRLKQKQKVRYNYGLTEKKLLQYVKIACQQKKKISAGQTLLHLLEMRLDNIVFRLGFATTLPAARQLITHGHVFMNGQKKDIPSSQCKVNDLISLKGKNITSLKTIPKFLSLIENSENLVGKIRQYPDRDDIALNVNELLVIEYYSRNL
uniref:Small ribosomal subunit protein uS4c n=1 Tax=Halimeda micronesica TaxID=170426 RepID=A0A386AXH9_9CHLO|nr:ribosomal protein S4 [Halimeda micronesica]